MPQSHTLFLSSSTSFTQDDSRYPMGGKKISWSKKLVQCWIKQIKTVSLSHNFSESLKYSMFCESPGGDHGKWSFTNLINYGTLFAKK